MCVIIVQPKEAKLKKDRAKRLWDKNPEGGGFAYINDDGEVVTEKFMKFKDFWSKFTNIRSSLEDRDYLLHMRIATHGTVDLDNVHPFQVDEHTVVAHNGIIRGVPDYKDGRSDTRVFIDEVLPGMPEDWLDNPYLFDMVQEWIGWSKLAFLTTNPALKKDFYILNERKGTYKDKMWFSNNIGLDKSKYSGKDGFAQGKQYGFRGGKPYKQDVVVGGKRYGEREPFSAQTQGKVAQNRSMYTQNLQNYWETSEGWVNLEHLREERRENEMKALESIRRHLGFVKDLDFNPVTKIVFCYGCDDEVDRNDGTCSCFIKICQHCEVFAGDCVCVGGFSVSLIYAGQATPELQKSAREWRKEVSSEQETERENQLRAKELLDATIPEMETLPDTEGGTNTDINVF
jgi:glutamine amidotransferase